MTSQMQVDNLKASCQYFAAGALAYALGKPRQYGQHFGMKSSRDLAMRTFFDGYDAASQSHRAMTQGNAA